MVSDLLAGIEPLHPRQRDRLLPQLLTRTGAQKNLGQVAGFISERWPASNRNGVRLQLGTRAGFASELAAGFNWNSHQDGCFRRRLGPEHMCKAARYEQKGRSRRTKCAIHSG
jgi:hypothetical protein